MNNTEKIETLDENLIPRSLITEELEGLYGSAVLTEMNHIINLYEVYEKGADFFTEGHKGDYTPSDLRFKHSASLIDKEARFFMSKSPDFWVDIPGNSKPTDLDKANNVILQTLIDNVLKANRLNTKLIKAAKDCFIGKRVAYFVNFDEVRKTIKVDFIPSLEFVYDTDPADSEVISKITAFYTVEDSKTKANQRIYRKRYWMQEGYCWISEAIFDGLGNLIEEITADRATKFTSIPGGVILNDGLTGDMSGESEIEKIQDSESWFSRLSNADMDAERQGMNPIRWARDMSPDSTKGLSIAAGSFWDLATDPSRDETSGEVGVLETNMTYVSAISATLNRIKSSMYGTIDMPDVSPEALQGIVSSGKTLKAIYWGLIVRCDEKMQAWRPALENIMHLIIDGSKLYPLAATGYIKDKIPEIPYEVRVDNQYPLPEDEDEEKNLDLTEVAAQTMSKKFYMKKWRNLTDEEADAELQQIAQERELLEDSFMNPPPGTLTGGQDEGE